MGHFSVFHWLVFIAFFSYLIPLGMLFKRTGHSMLWCFPCFVPLFAFIAFWVIAFMPWPIDSKAANP